VFYYRNGQLVRQHSKWVRRGRSSFPARLRARETPAGSESGRVSRLPPPSRVQGAWPSHSPDRAASRVCTPTRSKWPKTAGARAVLAHVCAPARRPPEANLAELVGCPHPPVCRVLGLLIRRAGQLPEAALRRSQSGPQNGR
jgi:hypothetical protein